MSEIAFGDPSYDLLLQTAIEGKEGLYVRVKAGKFFTIIACDGEYFHAIFYDESTKADVTIQLHYSYFVAVKSSASSQCAG